jgi:hypothetical protein
MEVIAGGAAATLEKRRLPHCQNPLWRWSFAPQRSKTWSPSDLH